MDQIRLPASWTQLDDKRSALLSKELSRELPAGHPLYGEFCTAIATSQRVDVDLIDDVLFRRPDGSFALVHLTWRVETDPAWPWTKTISTQADLLDALDSELGS